MTSTTDRSFTAESTSRFVRTSRFRVRYHEAGTGHPLVLLHGSGPGATAWSNFASNIEPLSRTHRVIAIDMPGWGESDTQNAATGFDHTQTLLEVLDALGIGSAALVGNSMGGMTAITLAVEHPDRVSHLVTMGAPCPGPNLFAPGGVPSEGLRVLHAAYLDPSPEAMSRLVRVMCFDASTATDELAATRSAAALAHPEHLRSWAERAKEPVNAAFFALGSRLHEITAPMLAIHGRDDRVISYENSLRLVAAVGNSRLVLINRCGHWVQVEHAAEFNRLVAQFLGGG